MGSPGSARGRRKRAGRRAAAYFAWIGARCCAPGRVAILIDPAMALRGQETRPMAHAPPPGLSLVVGYCCGRPVEMRRLGDGAPVCKP